MSEELKARIVELEAQLAQRWQPLPDGYFQSSITNGMYAVSTRSDSLECYMAYMGEWKYICSIELPDNIRLCHLVERAEVQPPQAHEREIIEAMVEDWLQLYEPGSNEWADAQVIVSWLNNYRGTFADDLRQQVTERAEVQPYSHRNGETEPPTEAGWYWFRGNVSSSYRGEVPYSGSVTILDSMYENRGLCVISTNESPTSNIEKWQGQWYGLIIPPWEVDHE